MGPTGAAGPTGATGAAGSPVIGGYAANATGAIVAVVLSGTNIPLPNNQVLGTGLTINGSNDTITVLSAGLYYIDYDINITTNQLMGTRILRNGTEIAQSKIIPALSRSQYNATFLVQLAAGDTISLQFFGLLGAVTLIGSGSVGASLTIMNLNP
jgi:hypothetical protein